MSLTIDTLGKKALDYTHDKVVTELNKLDNLSKIDKEKILADWGQASSKGVGGQHFAALKEKPKSKSKKKKKDAKKED